jgi:hypothetical protein
MTDLAALIEELEKAQEGSRQLDDAIAAAIGSVTIPWRVLSGIDDGRTVRGSSPSELLEIARSPLNICASDRYLPRFTTSVDDALTLVPEGWSSVEIRREPWWLNPTSDGRPNPNKFPCDAAIHKDGHEHIPIKYVCRGESGLYIDETTRALWGAFGGAWTLPLALCIAALRARQAMERGE